MASSSSAEQQPAVGGPSAEREVIEDASAHLADLTDEERAEAYKHSIKMQFPELDWLMIETVVDIFMKNPEASPEDFVKNAPENYFMEDKVKQVRVEGGPPEDQRQLEQHVPNEEPAGAGEVRGGATTSAAADQRAPDHHQQASTDPAQLPERALPDDLDGSRERTQRD